MGDQTLKNLKEAFAGESQASRRYVVFARRAEEEGFHNLARLFRAISESETVHAVNHLKAITGTKTSLENVEEALKGEKAEYSDMYPMFMDQAKRDLNNDALTTFHWANEAEMIHGDLYERAVESLKKGEDMQAGDFHVCSVCGYTFEGELPETCPLCGKGRDKFMPAG